MQNRKELKRKAKEGFCRNYWGMIAVCFILSFVCGEYASSTSATNTYDESQALPEGQVAKPLEGQGNWDIVKDTVKNREPEAASTKEEAGTRRGADDMADTAVGSIFNSISSDYTTLLNIIGVFFKALGEEWTVVLIFALAALGSMAFYLFVDSPLLIGGKRYYLDICEGLEGLKIKIIACIYRKGILMNTVKVMFFKWLYLTLWTVTIIGGIIKYYEYRVIPFLLAENPNLGRKQVFDMAKDMMRGNKWNMFVLDLSFIGWVLLTGATFGLAGIFYVNPYQSLTRAEFYIAVRDEAAGKNPGLYEPLLTSTF